MTYACYSSNNLQLTLGKYLFTNISIIQIIRSRRFVSTHRVIFYLKLIYPIDKNIDHKLLSISLPTHGSFIY